MHLGKFVTSRQNTNIMTVTAPHRHNLRMCEFGNRGIQQKTA
jgi:hypothetical protein